MRALGYLYDVTNQWIPQADTASAQTGARIHLNKHESATFVIFLIWLSWNVNALFFGGALATEAALALQARRPVGLADIP